MRIETIETISRPCADQAFSEADLINTQLKQGVNEMDAANKQSQMRTCAKSLQL